jgi:hypothetical protein
MALYFEQASIIAAVVCSLIVAGLDDGARLFIHERHLIVVENEPA